MKIPKYDFRQSCLPYMLERVGGEGSLWYRAFNRTYLDLGDHRPHGSHRPCDIEWIESGGLLLHINKRQKEKFKRLGCRVWDDAIALYGDETNPQYKQNWDRYQKVLQYLTTLQNNSSPYGEKQMSTLLVKLKKQGGEVD